MKCPKTGKEHEDYDFDGNGESTSGCDCARPELAEDLTSTPTNFGPEGEEPYGEAGDVDESLWTCLADVVEERP